MEKLKICAIDPGIKGAIGVIDQNGNFIRVEDTPVYKTGVKNQQEVDAIRLVQLLLEIDPIVFILEKVHAMPKQGVTSSMNFGINFGILKGSIGVFKMKPIMVTPQAWKKHFGLIKKPKDDARTLAQNIFPETSLHLKKHVDRADALLMAKWYQETQLNKKGENLYDESILCNQRQAN